MDNQRLIIWGLFAFMVYLTWQTWMQDHAPPPPEPNAAPGEAALPVSDAPADLDSLPDLDEDLSELPTVDPQAPITVADAAVEDDAERITVRTDVFEIVINTLGGTVTQAKMLNYPVAKDMPDTKVMLLDSGEENFGQIRSWLRGKGEGTSAPGAATVFDAAKTSYELNGEDTLVVPLTWTNDAGVDFEKRFVFSRGSYVIALEQNVTNGGDAVWRGDQVTQLVKRSFTQERSMFNVDSYSFDGALIYDGSKADKLKRDDLLDDGPVNFTSEDGWYASIQHHFMVAIVPDEPATNIFQARVDGNRLTASVISAPQAIGPAQTASFRRALFVGPKLQSQLEKVHPKLKLSVDYGWLTILSQPMFWLLSWIHKFVGNWGWSIIGVTILIKGVFYKLTESSGRSMAKMREIQPRMKALQDRYKDDRQALSQAMMDLYKREKINPAAGCLPILIQMPFFLAFYWVLVESVEMRQAPFALWITDLSSRDPYFILPLIMGAAMLFQQKLNPAPADPVQAKVMQIMPVMFTGFFAFFPSGLVLYWVTNTLLSIAQQWNINKVVHAEAKAKKGGKKKKPKADSKDDS
ncbi:MAG: membrane protein insertase YidC [Gammaproteobacteria bacterium]|nr:membrane protein insertase YidC [Gammaproteobacteria bacterium]